MVDPSDNSAGEAHLHPGRIRELILAFTRQARDAKRRLRDVLADGLSPLRLLPGDRRRIARGCYRLEQQARRIDFALDQLDRDDAREIAARLLAGEITVAAAARVMPKVDWDHVARCDERIAALDDPDVRFGLTWSMPDWLARRFRTEFGGEAAQIAASLNQEPPITVRTNTLKAASRDQLAEQLAREGVKTRPTKFAPHGLAIEGSPAIFATQAFRDGWFEQQDEASQLCCLLVAPPPRGRVLDACAGAGGKTLALAAALGNRGDVLAIDMHDGRLNDLVERRRRAGTDNVRSMPVPGDAWPDEVTAFASSADRILLDVPCSGIGSWRRRTDARWTSTAEGLAELRSIQTGLLGRALRCLAPGARLVYATCTMFADENEEQVQAALGGDPTLELVRAVEILGRSVADPISDPSGTFLRLVPHRHGTDGFFAAVIRRKRV